MDKFYERFPDAKKQAEYSKLEFVLPPELIALDGLLSQITVHTFKYVEYNSKKRIWQIDEHDLSSAFLRYQRWARTPDQIKRWEFAKNYADYLNQIAGPIALRQFTNPIMTHHARLGYVPDPNFVFGDYKH